MFVLCLDDDQPATPNDITRSFLYGNGSNRYFVVLFGKFMFYLQLPWHTSVYHKEPYDSDAKLWKVVSRGTLATSI